MLPHKFTASTSAAISVKVTGQTFVLVRPDTPWEVTADKVLSKCGWSPLEGHTFNWKVERTFANGHPVYSDGMVDDAYRGEELRFGE